jgi:hypothetical protein
MPEGDGPYDRQPGSGGDREHDHLQSRRKTERAAQPGGDRRDREQPKSQGQRQQLGDSEHGGQDQPDDPRLHESLLDGPQKSLTSR